MAKPKLANAPSTIAANTNFNDEEEEKPLPPWYDWVERNAKPKVRYYPRPKREPTRWQKRGPMKKKDWKRFFKWAAKNANPREEYKIVEPPPPVDKKGRPILPPPIDYSAQLAKARILATPRNQREKYVFPPKPKYPFLPTFNPAKPAKPERGRPFKAPRVPDEFPHFDIECEFWSILRFPVSPDAKRAVAKPRTRELALPRVVPPKVQHCPIPEVPPEYIPPRIKMTYRQWQAHLRRLQYLAKPNVRPTFYHC